MRIGINERFWEKVIKARNNECWLWIGATSRGYGQIGNGKGKVIYASRLSWEMHHGVIPEGKCVCHHCDNPLCVNPVHLFIGSKSDNSKDMSNKLRGRSGRRKLTDEDVRSVVRLHKDGINNTKIAKQFNVQPSAICKIVNGYTPRFSALIKDVTGTACEACVSG